MMATNHMLAISKRNHMLLFFVYISLIYVTVKRKVVPPLPTLFLPSPLLRITWHYLHHADLSALMFSRYFSASEISKRCYCFPL